MVVKVLEEHTEDLDLTLATDQHSEPRQARAIVVARMDGIAQHGGDPRELGAKRRTLPHNT